MKLWLAFCPCEGFWPFWLCLPVGWRPPFASLTGAEWRRQWKIWQIYPWRCLPWFWSVYPESRKTVYRVLQKFVEFLFKSVLFIRAFLDISNKLKAKKLGQKKTQANFPKNSSKQFENSIFCQLESLFLLQKAHKLIDLALKFVQTEVFLLNQA